MLPGRAAAVVDPASIDAKSICDPKTPPPVVDIFSRILATQAKAENKWIRAMGTPIPITCETNLRHNVKILIARTEENTIQIAMGVATTPSGIIFALENGDIKGTDFVNFRKGKVYCFYIPICAENEMLDGIKVLLSHLDGKDTIPKETLTFIKSSESGYNLCKFILFGYTPKESTLLINIASVALGLSISIGVYYLIRKIL